MATETNNQNHEGLKHGEYKVIMTQLNKHNELVTFDGLVKPLTQDQLADEWLRVSNKCGTKMIHHFSIYLSQLPMNLWCKVRRTYSTDRNSDFYKKIKHNNYHYSIKHSSSDEKVFELFRHIMLRTPDLDKISELYKQLNENRVKGWLMIRASRMIKQ